MTTRAGKDGSLSIDSNLIAVMTSWSLDETAEALENTAIGLDSRTYQAGLLGFTLAVEGFYDETDAGRGAMIAGASVTFELQPGGTDPGEADISGGGIVNTVSETAPVDGFVEFSISIQGSGDLTRDVNA